MNLRGSDIPFNPVFFSWLVVKSNGEVHLFVDRTKITISVRQHLNLEADIDMVDGVTVSNNNNVSVILHPYEEIEGFLKTAVMSPIMTIPKNEIRLTRLHSTGGRAD